MLMISSCTPSKLFIEGNDFLLPFMARVEDKLDYFSAFLIKDRFPELLKLDECSFMYTTDTGLIYDTFYIHEKTRSLSDDEYGILMNAIPMDYCVSQTSNQSMNIWYRAEHQKSIDYFFDDDHFDGCRCFYNIVIVDDMEHSVETWTAYIDDAQGSASDEFTLFMQNTMAAFVRR